MALDAKKKRHLRLERERMTRYQHQHRGLSFLKLWLPPTTDRKVNIIGLNNHIYKGKIPTFPLDQLPPEVDPKSIDEEELYKEIRDMRFPVVPPLKPLGPARRIGGEYTTVKRMTFAPVEISLDDDKMGMPLLGTDGKVYQGTTRAAPAKELDRRLKGSNRPVKTPAMYRSDHGTVKPTVVSLYVDGKPPTEREPPVPLIQLPYADLNKLMKLMKIKSPEEEKEATRKPKEEDKESKPAEETEASEGEESSQFTSSESVGSTGGGASDVEGSSTTSMTEGSSGVTDIVSEGEDTDVEVSKPELSESEPEEEKHEVSEAVVSSESEPEEEKHEVSEAVVSSESEPEEKHVVSEPEVSESEPEEKPPEEI